MKKTICTYIVLGCALWMIAAAGASDLETMSLGSIVAQEIAALAIMAVSAKIGGLYQ